MTDSTKCTCGNEDSLHGLSSLYRFDPTRTLVLRQQFSAQMTKRFVALKGKINKKVIEEDFFGLKPRKDPFKVLAEPYTFPLGTSKYNEFMEWLREQVNLGILEVGADISRLTPEMLMKGWTNPYIQSSYQKGILRGRKELKKAGLVPAFDAPLQTAFNMPFHMDRVSMLYARAFADLEGITNAMSSQISRVLADGMVKGLGPYEIARTLNDRVDKIGLVRAKMLARTEVVRAHHSANIGEYRRAGVEGVKIQAEWLTAGDIKVCAQCSSLAIRGDIASGIYSLNAIEGLIPAHPNCRCMAIPYNPEWAKLKGKVPPPVKPIDHFAHPKEVDDALLAFETKRRKMKTEFGTIIDSKTGEVLLAKTSRLKNAIYWTDDEFKLMNKNALSHNHPMGTSFSQTDIHLMLSSGSSEARAIGTNYQGLKFNYVSSFDWDYLKKIDPVVFSRHPDLLGTRELGASLANNTSIRAFEDSYAKWYQEAFKKYTNSLNAHTIELEEANFLHHHFVWKHVAKDIPWFNYERVEVF